tara:strand:+ start:16692 stop:16976 length:285 start_codon:yes stop_codon:yes gene_type:complete
MLQHDYDEVHKNLQEKIGIVKFTKKDGTERVMACTLMKDLLPSIRKYTPSESLRNEEVMVVWDIPKEAFRSFRLDSILSIQWIEHRKGVNYANY